MSDARYEIAHTDDPSRRLVASPGLFTLDETATEIAALLADGADTITVTRALSRKTEI